MSDYLIPLIIRGEIIEDDLIGFSARHGQLSFQTPDLRKHVSRLILRDPNDLADLYRLSLDD
ncbi:MAG TPA: hypothetical protein VKS60_05110, partial [Stellaceae bacterium]|nr:hypothetical protein [Stellaceae bacterium]